MPRVCVVLEGSAGVLPVLKLAKADAGTYSCHDCTSFASRAQACNETEYVALEYWGAAINLMVQMHP